MEVNPRSRGVLRACLPRLAAMFPGRILPGAFDGFDSIVPQDIFTASRSVPAWLPLLPAPPTLIGVSTPCVGTSRAGPGRGIQGSASSVTVHALRIVADILAALSPQASSTTQLPAAPCGWIFETAEIKDSDHRLAVRDAARLYSAAMGPRIVDNASWRGSTAQRFTEMYSNLASPHDWLGVPARPRCLPFLPLPSILRPGETVQIWNIRFHGPPVWPNEEGSPLVVYPKHIRYSHSHQWDFAPIPPCVRRSARFAADPLNGWGHGVGVSWLNDNPALPSPTMLELAMGFPPGFTAASHIGSSEVLALSANDRWACLGDVWDPNLIASTIGACSTLDYQPPALNTPRPRPPPCRPHLLRPRSVPPMFHGLSPRCFPKTTCGPWWIRPARAAFLLC